MDYINREIEEKLKSNTALAVGLWVFIKFVYPKLPVVTEKLKEILKKRKVYK